MTTFAMILGMMPSAMGRGEGARVPRADLDCHHRRADHLDGADAGRGAGGLPAARAAPGAGGGVAPQPSPGPLRQATRIAGVLVLLALVGWFLAAARRAFGAEPRPAAGAARPAPMTLTFDQALRARAERQPGAEGGRRRACAIGEARVAEAQGRLPAAGELQLPVHAVAAVSARSGFRPASSGPRSRPSRRRSPPERLSARHVAAALHRRAADQQPQAMQRAALDASRLELERARQELQSRVVEVFYNALTERAGRRRGRRADPPRRDAAGAGAGALRGRHGGPPRRAARPRCELANARARRIQMTGRRRSRPTRPLRTVLSLPQSQPLTLRRHARRRAGDPGARGARRRRCPPGPTCGPSTSRREHGRVRGRTWPTPSGSRRLAFTRQRRSTRRTRSATLLDCGQPELHVRRWRSGCR